MRYIEVCDGRGGQQTFGSNVKCKRTFVVTVDDPTTSVSAIAQVCGINWLDQHPEFPVYCTEINAQQDGDPLHYKVEFTYDLVKPEDKQLAPWDRADKFTFSGSVASGPAILHYNQGFSSPAFIVNTAGDPLEGAEKEYSSWHIQITGSRQSFPRFIAMQYVNAVNSDSWSGMPAGTVKCQGISGQREVEQVGGEDVSYWSVSVELAYRPEGWTLKLWDIGYQQVVGGRKKKILDANMEPVSDPSALSNGVAKTNGSPPDMLTFKVYNELPFNGAFTQIPN